MQHHNLEENDSPMTQARQQKQNSVNLLPAAILIAAIVISASILYAGKQFASINLRSSVLGQNTAINPQANNPTPKQAPTQPDTGPVKVALNDAPVLGNKNAKLTIVDFSDYECPFCKKSFTDILPSLKTDYIESGKVNLVYKNYPLPFHQNAPKEAEAALCARDQGGDSVYFKFHDQIYTQTTSNGTGLALTQLPIIAKSLGLNVSKFQLCLDFGKYKDYVDKDIAQGNQVGVSGTPTWFVGKTNSDGTITGTKIVGAQPYTAFKAIIEQQLKSVN
jgi:protein-disulfide isomerase